MPDKYKEMIMDRSPQSRHRMDRYEHWTGGNRENIFELVIYPSGEICLDRVDDWWEGDQGFIPKHWEST